MIGRIVSLVAGLVLLAALSGCSGGCRADSVYREPASWFASYGFDGERILVAETAQRCFSYADTVQVSSEVAPLDIQALVADLAPEYVLAGDGISWDGLRSQPWFHASYRQVQAWPRVYPTAVSLALFERIPSASRWDAIEDAAGVFAIDAVVLTGHRLSSRTLTPGIPLVVTLFWADVPGYSYADLAVSFRLTADATGRVWYLSETKLEATGLSPYAERRLAQRYEFTPPGDLPQGGYGLTVSLRERNGRTVPVEDSGGEPRESLCLATIAHPPDVGQAPVPMESRTDYRFGSPSGDIRLIGFDGLSGAQPGGDVRTVLLWETVVQPAADYLVFVHYAGADGALAAQSDGTPVYGFYPTTQWHPGDFVRDEHPVTLPVDLARGGYDVLVGLYDGVTGERVPVYDASGVRLPDDRAMLYQLKVR